MCIQENCLNPTHPSKHIAKPEDNFPPPPFLAMAILLRMIQALGDSPTFREVGCFSTTAQVKISTADGIVTLVTALIMAIFFFLKQRYWLSV